MSAFFMEKEELMEINKLIGVANTLLIMAKSNGLHSASVDYGDGNGGMIIENMNVEKMEDVIDDVFSRLEEYL